MARRFLPSLLTAVAVVTIAACSDATLAPTPPRRAVSDVVVADTPSVGYLALFFTSSDDKGLYYALSTDGRHFESLNGGRAVLRSTLDDKLLRDPMVLRDQNGVYHLVATVSWTHRVVDMWDSYDLVSWTNERLIQTGPAASTKAWAPELAYDAQHDEYLLFFTADEGAWPSTAIYAMMTPDFQTFSAPSLLYRDSVTAAIDATIVPSGGVYHLFFRADGIFHATSKDAMGPYGVADRVTPDLLEGPFVFPSNDTTAWTLILDNWQDNAGYTVMESPNLKSWTTLTNPAPPLYDASVSFPAGVRHGSVIRLSQAQIDTLRSAFATPYATP